MSRKQRKTSEVIAAWRSVISDVGESKPAPAQRYLLELNGDNYGVGSAEYMVELISDYVRDNDRYGRDEVKLTIRRR